MCGKKGIENAIHTETEQQQSSNHYADILQRKEGRGICELFHNRNTVLHFLGYIYEEGTYTVAHKMFTHLNVMHTHIWFLSSGHEGGSVNDLFRPRYFICLVVSNGHPGLHLLIGQQLRCVSNVVRTFITKMLWPLYAHKHRNVGKSVSGQTCFIWPHAWVWLHSLETVWHSHMIMTPVMNQVFLCTVSPSWNPNNLTQVNVWATGWPNLSTFMATWKKVSQGPISFMSPDSMLHKPLSVNWHSSSNKVFYNMAQ